MIPVASMDLDFSHPDSSSYFSCPSTPNRFGNYFFSAPTSPSRASEFYPEFDHLSGTKSNGSPPRVPFDWEEKPGKPKSSYMLSSNNDDDFAFDFSEELERASLSAEELFDGGKIRPLKPPPALQLGAGVDGNSGRKPPISSPRNRKNVSEQERGRERGFGIPPSRSGRRTRSLSPFRVAELAWEEEEEQQMNKQHSVISKPTTPSSLISSSSKGSKKWSFRDFLLFRSASEGRATDRDPFRKYAGLFRKQDMKNDSFRSIDSSGSISRRRGPVSAHELHYTMNRAVSEDLKKKTFLPYKQGILGRLAFNPALHALANGFGSLGRGG